MDGGGSTSGTEERGAERAMDDYLKSIGLHRKRIAKDGSCLFRAVAEQVLHCQSLHTKVRAKCVEFLRQNRESYEAFIEGDFEEYLIKLQDPQQWVGEVEINALAIMYKRDFLIYQEPGKAAVNITDNNFKDQVRLCFLNGNHYDSVYPISHIRNAALCQSVLYELLYDGVFRADRSLVNLCNRTSRPSDLLSDDNMAACGSSDESDGGASEPLWVENETSSAATKHRGRGRGRQLPERVRRSLNQTLYRNVEYDVWHKTKRAQQKMDYCIAAGMQFSVGDRCQVRLEGSGRSYNATVKEVPLNNGPVTVHIEELGRKQVPLWSLRPPADRSSWSTVVGRDKKLSNGHGEWEDRGRGRGRGRSLPASSVSQVVTAAGGRVQKQHSWPPQASTEEGPRSGSRKSSTSAVDATFGLTEEQRKAKIEEEMNVALVEIQLRDEHSFPALGAQSGPQTDGGRKKKRPQSDTVKSPAEDVRPPLPPAGERPKSSTPPLTDAAPPTAPPSGSSHPDATSLSSLKAATPNTNMAAAPTAASSCASASAPVSPPAGGAVPPSVPASATLRSFLPPVLPTASSPPPSSSSSLPPKSSASLPPPLSSLPPPTFISPIAPSPAAAQGFLPRASPPAPSLPHSSTPPLCSSSDQKASSVPQVAPVHEAPGLVAQNNLIVPEGASNASESFESPALLAQISEDQNQISEDQIQPPLPSGQTLTDQMQNEPQSSLSHPQPHPNSESEGLPQSQSEVVQVQSSGASVPDAPSEQAQTSVPYPHPHLQQTQPPHPSQVPHPSPSLSSPPHPPVQPQTTTHNQAEAPPPPTNQAQTQSDSQSHLPHPLLPVQPPPPHPQSIPGTVPLQQLSQLYQDPLYPGFPQNQKGDMVQTPHFSSSKSGDDLPPDVNILRFFFNLGVKAYSMPMFAPYIYLLPLQQAHTLQPKPPSCTPSPPPNPPTRHQEVYHPQYPQPPASMPPPYDRHVPPTEHPHPSDPSFSQAGYPVNQPLPHRVSSPSLSWQPHQMPPPRNPPYTVGYPTPSPPYPVPQPLSQGFHPGPAPGHSLYTQSVSPYPPSSLGYHSASAHEELQVNQVEQHPPPNGDTMSGLRIGQVPGPAAAANNRPAVVPGFALKKEHGDSLNTAVLLVDPPLNPNKPILVSNSGVKDIPISMTTMKPNSNPGSPAPYEIMSKTILPGDNHQARGYRGHQKQPTAYIPLGVLEPGQVSYLPPPALVDHLSVACSTEDDWDEKPTTFSHRGQRRGHRGGGGRGGRVSHDSGRGANRRRHGGELWAGLNYNQYNSSSYRGRGRERDY